MKCSGTPTVQISRMAMNFLGTWEDAKKRFNLSDDVQVVNLIEGTKLKSSLPPLEFKNRLEMLEKAGATK